MFASQLSGPLLAALLIGVSAAADEIGTVHFNQTWIEDRARLVELDDPMRAFAMIFARLPETARVYPTENYYYFRFAANGRDYAGNFRLHPVERDEGLINFAFFDTTDPTWFRHLLLGAKDGVEVERVGDLSYDVGFGGRTVRFDLNPLPQTGGAPLGPGETHLGRGFDESGMVFQLVFDTGSNGFLWVLDPEQPAPLELVPMGPDLDVHVASGFVFLRDGARHVLVAIDSAQSLRNTYYDGPFDQLPDNWLPETPFQDLVFRMSPELRGRMNARGEFEGGESRIAIAPYMHYRSLSEVWERVAGCRAMPGNQRLACIQTPHH